LKIINFKLPNTYKKVGLTIGGLLMLGMIISKFSGYNPSINKDAIRTFTLLALLIASLSREQFEDEYVAHLRGQSYIIAFVCTLGYSIIIPLVAFVLDFLIVRITGDGQTSFYEISAFEVMFMMICFQILFFEVLKRLDREE
jgi:hypothetical protein